MTKNTQQNCYNKMPPRMATLSPCHTGDGNGDNLSPKTATVAEFGDYSRHCGQGFIAK